ncbi:MAG: hypothetical protein ACLUQ2_06785 [Klebsiella pneumoniae]
MIAPFWMRSPTNIRATPLPS